LVRGVEDVRGEFLRMGWGGFKRSLKGLILQIGDWRPFGIYELKFFCWYELLVAQNT